MRATEDLSMVPTLDFMLRHRFIPGIGSASSR